MVITPIRTPKILPGQKTLFQFLDENIKDLKEDTVLVVTSKVVSICEGRVIPIDKADKHQLIRDEAESYFVPPHSHYREIFTITRKTILGSSGIDESNGGGHYVLLPEGVQSSANAIRRHLKDRFNLKNLAVIITDSTSIPLRLGAIGTCLAYSGFSPINDYRGHPDLFGRPFTIERANVTEALAVASVIAMGEGDEQTPLCVITENPLINFRDQDPSAEELDSVFLSLKEDLFAPFINNGQWQKGGRHKS